jgi:CHAT domain
MEVVNAGAVPVDEAIGFLLDRDGLQKLVGDHGVVCFALVSEITAPDFYGRLIERSSEIDRITRHHIAFVVFYGDRSAVSHRVPTSYGAHLASYQVQGMSISTHDQWIPAEFDEDLGELFRSSPSEVDRAALSRSMGGATRLLMERYAVPEDALPCLLFIDASHPTQSVVVRLIAADPLRSLYEDALARLSQEFSDLSRFWQQRAEINQKQWRLKSAEDELQRLRQAIADCDERLRQIPVAQYSSELAQWEEIRDTIEGREDDASVYAAIEHLPMAEPVIQTLRARERRVAKAKTIEEMLRLGSRGREERAMGDKRLRSGELESELARVRRSIDAKDARISSMIQQAINRLKGELRDQARKDDLQEQLNALNALINEHTPTTLRAELADLERPLRARGYGDDVLAARSPAAFSVVKLLHEMKRLGAKDAEPSSTELRMMTILFLAANPPKTKHLDLEDEVRTLDQELASVIFRDSINLVAKHAVRPDDLVRHVRRYKPNVIHFSGHGSSDGIVLRDDTGTYRVVEGRSLRRFLEGRGIDLVVLNACYSQEQADTIGDAVKTIVGTTNAVGDEAARRFTAAFYRSLGNGLSVGEAYRDGGDSVALHGLSDAFHSAGDLDLILVSGRSD